MGLTLSLSVQVSQLLNQALKRWHDYALPNGRRVSGERRAEGDERVRCTRVLGRRARLAEFQFDLEAIAKCHKLAGDIWRWIDKR